MKASVNDVAERAGVSVSTVSRAFTRPELVSERTRKKVLQVADELNFSVSRSAVALKRGQTFRIALLAGGHIDWFSARILEGLNSVLHDTGYDFSIYAITHDEERARFFEQLPVRRNADAIIVSSFNLSPDETDRLHAMGIPIVGINVASPGEFDASIGIDDTTAIQILVRHLVALGHRRIAYLYEESISPLRFSSYQRVAGFTQLCDELDGVAGTAIAVRHGDDCANVAITTLLSQPDPPTAICVHQDSWAIPLFFRLPRYGIHIPDDLSVTGFDDSDFAEEVGLTTVRQLPRDMAATAARMALDLINGRTPEHRHITAPVQLMLRSSTAAPRA